ncbi:MAG: type IX secretion system membrane protein PorP/SprF [Cyclobacteriaceae bacterium]|nr:type IX secretion system membrane protein PorP/SprF [Cyclobacteriaceae bacterium]
MKIWISLILLIVVANFAHGQQDPLYSQYLNNPVLLNPAYAGINNRLDIVAGYRSQWGGFDGSPTTLNFSGHTSLVQNKVGAGISVVQDKLGENKFTQYNALYSYKIDLKSGEVLSFGLQTGMTNYRNDNTMLNPQQTGDPAFGFVNELKFNIGAGVMLKSERYMLGFSVPRITRATVDMGGQKIDVYNQHFYLLGGYVFYLTDRIRLKPSILGKATKGAFSTDLNFNLNIDENYTAGVFTRNFNTYGILLQANVKDYRVGYVFEVPTNNSVGTRFTTHEISLALSMAVFKEHSRSKNNF